MGWPKTALCVLECRDRLFVLAVLLHSKAQRALNDYFQGKELKGEAEAEAVVAVARRGVIANRHAAVPGVVEPTATLPFRHPFQNRRGVGVARTCCASNGTICGYESLLIWTP